jgi:hypothetical protein
MGHAFWPLPPHPHFSARALASSLPGALPLALACGAALGGVVAPLAEGAALAVSSGSAVALGSALAVVAAVVVVEAAGAEVVSPLTPPSHAAIAAAAMAVRRTQPSRFVIA